MCSQGVPNGVGSRAKAMHGIIELGEQDLQNQSAMRMWGMGDGIMSSVVELV